MNSTNDERRQLQQQETMKNDAINDNRNNDTTTTTTTTNDITSTSTSTSTTTNSIQFTHFIAHDNNMTCSADEHARPFNNQIRGVNIGGWMVLEPWITPSMFYQFLGTEGGYNTNTTAYDMYTFCTVLGPIEANKQLHTHWSSWVTEDIIQQLAQSNAVNSLRVPIGDYQFVPYGPYVDGCIDGSLEYLDQLLDWAYTYGLSVLLDIHTMKDSQNGFDNSGQAMGFEWTSPLSSNFAGLITFEHWPIRTANWIGSFNTTTAQYDTISSNNINHALTVIEKIVTRYSSHPAILGLQPLNEPWQYTPIPVLQRFYWEGYKRVKKIAPYWKYIMHDSFRFDTNIWGGFMAGCPERALDTHIYQAWREPDSRVGFFQDACNAKKLIANMEREFGPVIVGEWSLATDNCAMWLNGFNDNLPGFPRLPCKYTSCISGQYHNESHYHGKNTTQPGVPIDPSKPMQGPYGTGMSGPIFGLCPGSRDWLQESNGNPLTGQDWIRAPPIAPIGYDDTDFVMQRLALKKINAFSGIGHGFFFWNFRTDLYDPQWSYMAGLERGWIPKGNLNDDLINTACAREDEGDFKCILKRGQLETNIRTAAKFILIRENIDITNSSSNDEAAAAAQQVLHNLTGTALENAVGILITSYFDKYRTDGGATCDFGGIAMLVETERNITNTDPLVYQYDQYNTTTIQYIQRGPTTVLLITGSIMIGIIGGLIGFIIAMRRSPTFNRRVRSNSLFMTVTKSNNNILRSALNLPQLTNDEYTTFLNTNSNTSTSRSRNKNYNSTGNSSKNNNDNTTGTGSKMMTKVGSDNPLSW